MTEKAIRCATLVKNRQIVISQVISSLTDPIRHAIRRQRIPVPVQEAALQRSGQMDEFACPDRAQAAKAALPFTD
ncbi:MAG: hypothetical protein P8X95_05330 [Anaerolineales bacterium]